MSFKLLNLLIMVKWQKIIADDCTHARGSSGTQWEKLRSNLINNLVAEKFWCLQLSIQQWLEVKSIEFWETRRRKLENLFHVGKKNRMMPVMDFCSKWLKAFLQKFYNTFEFKVRSPWRAVVLHAWQ